MGTKWVQTVTCLDCGFKWERNMESWGDCDFENEQVHSDECLFCQHAAELGITGKSFKLRPKRAMSYEHYKENVENEKERHEKIMKRLDECLKITQNKCKHKRSDYYPDPSGNNDSGYKCRDCGAWF